MGLNMSLCAFWGLWQLSMPKLQFWQKDLLKFHQWSQSVRDQLKRYGRIIPHAALFPSFRIVLTVARIHSRPSAFFRPAPIIPGKASKCSHRSFCTQQRILHPLPGNTKEVSEVVVVTSRGCGDVVAAAPLNYWLIIIHNQPLTRTRSGGVMLGRVGLIYCRHEEKSTGWEEAAMPCDIQGHGMFGHTACTRIDF